MCIPSHQLWIVFVEKGAYFLRRKLGKKYFLFVLHINWLCICLRWANLKILQNMRFFVNQDYNDSNALGYATMNCIGHLHWQVRVNVTFYNVCNCVIFLRVTQHQITMADWVSPRRWMGFLFVDTAHIRRYTNLSVENGLTRGVAK